MVAMNENSSNSTLSSLHHLYFQLYDHFFIWRTLIVIFLGLSALAGFVVVLVTHFMEPRLAQPIKEWKLCTSCLRERMASVGLMVSQLRCFAKTAILHRGFFSQLMTNSVRALSCTCPSTKSFVINSNDEFEKKVMNSKDPVIVNFHADWCEPCKILTPRLEKLVSPLENVHLAVIDVEKNVELVHTFEVKAVPAVIAVRNGQVEDKFIGLVDADMIDNLINKLIKKPADSQQEN
ncbi:Thioredoxin-T [Gryllus bimaculatus]|nr:Thioredoxin-T [Gryllus bimaculatus]